MQTTNRHITQSPRSDTALIPDVPLKLEAGVDSTRFVKTLEEHSVSVSAPDDDHARRILLTVNPTLLRQDIQELHCAFERAVKESQR